MCLQQPAQAWLALDAELGPQRPTAPRRTSPTPEEEGGKLRKAGVRGLALRTTAASPAQRRARAATLAAAGGPRAKGALLPATRRQRPGRSPPVRGRGKLQQGDSRDPRKCAMMEGGGKPELAGNSGGKCDRRRAGPAHRTTGETGARMAGISQDAGSARGECCPVARRCRRRGGPVAGQLPPGGALQKEKRLPVTGREPRQPRTHAPPPPPEHTHPGPPLPTSPARRLPSSAGPALQRRPPARSVPTRLQPGCDPPAVPELCSPSPTASLPPSPRPLLPPTPLQLLATPLRAPAAPAPGAGPASGPAPRAPPPSPHQPEPAAPPLSARTAPASEPAAGGGGASSGLADLSCHRPRLPPPAAGMPRAAVLRAASAAECSGSARPGPARLLGVSQRRGGGVRGGRRQVQTSREAGCVSNPSVLQPTPGFFEPLAPQQSGWGGENSDSRARQSGEALQFLASPAQPPQWAENPRHPLGAPGVKEG